jgi:hypothetical protein
VNDILNWTGIGPAIPVIVFGDGKAKYDDTFTIELTDEFGGKTAVGTGTIINDDERETRLWQRAKTNGKKCPPQRRNSKEP